MGPVVGTASDPCAAAVSSSANPPEGFGGKRGFIPQLLGKLKDGADISIDLHQADTHFEMLREILSHEQQYDVFLFSSFLLDSVISQHYFHEVSSFGIKNLDQISIDFRNLDFDPDNHYLVPILWGVNGWLVPPEDADKEFSLAKAVYSSSQTLQVLPDPAELYMLMKALRPAVQMFVQTGADQELAKELAPLKSSIHVLQLEEKSSPKSFMEITNGELTPDILKNFSFRLPEEKGHLWLMLAAVAKNSKNASEAAEFIDALLAPQYSKLMATTAHMATTVAALDGDTELPLQKKANFIRALPISRIQLESHHEAFEPVFTGYLKNAYPSFFGVNARR